jgi:hypothetical protein
MDLLTLDGKLVSLTATTGALLTLAAEQEGPQLVVDAFASLAHTVTGIRDSAEGLTMGVSGDEVFAAVHAGLEELDGWFAAYREPLARFAPSGLATASELLEQLALVATELEAFDRPLLSELETPQDLASDQQTRDLHSVLELLDSAVARDDYGAIALWLPRARLGSSDPLLSTRAEAAVVRAEAALADDLRL